MSHVPRLSLGLILDDVIVPRWFRCALEHSLALKGIELTLVVQNGQGRPKGRRSGRLERLWRGDLRLRNVDTFLYGRYRAWDHRRHVRPSQDALARVSIEDLLGDAERIVVDPQRHGHVDRLAPVDLERIRAHAPDVLLRGGFGILRGEILDLPTHGIWSYHHGDTTIYRGGPAGFWETLRGEPVVGAVLQRLTDVLDDGISLARTICPVSRFSPAITRNNIYWDSVGLLPSTLRRLLLVGDPVDPNAAGLEAGGRVYQVPGTAPTLRMMARYATSRAQHRESVFVQHWSIAIYPLREDPIRDTPRGTPSAELTAPHGRFWADPFLRVQDGANWLFFEDCSYQTRRGVIACAPLTVDGHLAAPPRTVLEDTSHLSNPIVFDLDGRICMLPETVGLGRVQLYEAVEFPWRWAPAEILLPGTHLADPILHRHAGRFWLFGTAVPDHPGSRLSRLRLWHAEHLVGPWVEHPMSPVVTDCRMGRAAGRFFEHCGRWFRPAQDGALGYGTAVRFMEILELTPDRYREQERGRVEPGALNAQGTHTFSFSDLLVAVDVRRRRRRTEVGK